MCDGALVVGKGVLGIQRFAIWLLLTVEIEPLFRSLFLIVITRIKLVSLLLPLDGLIEIFRFRIRGGERLEVTRIFPIIQFTGPSG